MNAASRALQSNDVREAMLAFQAAIEEAEKFGSEDARLARTLEIAGNFLSTQGQFV